MRALTGRQHEVLQLAADGLTNQAIGLRLGISAATVQSHVESIRWHFGVSSKREAIVAATRAGVLT